MSARLPAALVLSCALAAGCTEDPQDHIRRARNLIFEERPEQALTEYRQALDLIERDESAEGRVLQARALKGAADVYYLELRDFVRAAETYRELIRVCPEAPESVAARIQLATILDNHLRDPRGAISLLSGAIERNAPDSAELTYKVSKLYYELADYQQASIEAQKVQEKFETSVYVDDALLLEAQALGMMTGRTAEAQRALQRLVEKFPESALVSFALYELGKIRAEAGEREAAIELYVRALERHPDPELVQDCIARLRRQIIERNPVGVGKARVAFDHKPRIRHRTSLEAAGGTAEEAARETGD